MSEKIERRLWSLRSAMLDCATATDGGHLEAKALEDANRRHDLIRGEFTRLEGVAKQLADAVTAVINCGASCSCEISNEELDAWDKVSAALAAYKELP